MSTDSSIGTDDPGSAKLSGIDDEVTERKRHESEDGGSVPDDGAGHDVTAEDIAAGNDQNVSADYGGRSGKTDEDSDDAIELGR